MSVSSVPDKYCHAKAEFTRICPSDVTFLVGVDKVEVKGHLQILANASTKICESGEPVVIFEDLNVEGFKLMMVYIYKQQKMRLDSEVEAARLYQVAKHFQIQKLVDKSIKKLEGMLDNVECLAKVLNEAIKLDLSLLKNYAIDCICWKWREMMESGRFLELNSASFNLVLWNENLQVESEIEVFLVAMSWAENQIVKKGLKVTSKQIRTELGRTLYSIRMPLLTPEEFINEIQLKPNRKIIFTAEEREEVATYLLGNQFEIDEDGRERLTIRFANTPRNHANTSPVFNRLLFQCNELESSTGSFDESLIIVHTIDENKASESKYVELDDSDYEVVADENKEEEMDESSNDSNLFQIEIVNTTSLAVNNGSPTKSKSQKKEANPDFLTLYEECKVESQKNPNCEIFTRHHPYLIMPGKLGAVNLLPHYFPKLVTFSVKYLLKATNHTAFRKYLCSLSASNLVFVKTELNNRFRNFLGSLTGLKNANVEVNGVTVLQIDKDAGILTISRIDPDEILDGLENWSFLRRIHLEFIHLPTLDILPNQHLQSLTLKSVTGIQGESHYGKFLASCPKLEEFTLDDFGYKGGYNPKNCLVLSDLGSSSKIRKLSVGKVFLTYSTNSDLITFPHLEELYISSSESDWSSYMQAITPNIFPNLKKAQICVNRSKVELVAQLLKIKTLIWISIWEMSLLVKTFNVKKKGQKRQLVEPSPEYKKAVQDVKKVLQDAELVDSSSTKTILLHRNLPDDPWSCENLKGKDKFPNGQFNEWYYEHFNWQMFYKDYEHYKINCGVFSKT